MKRQICTQCGQQGFPKTVVKGSFGVELLFWLCLILPGIIYTLWRVTTTYKACPACSAPNMVPLDTPRGRELAAKYGQE